MADPIPQLAPKAVAKQAPVLDIVKISKDRDTAIEKAILKNPIFRDVIETDNDRDTSIAAATTFLAGKLDEIESDDIDARENALNEIMQFVQVMNKQLGAEQAREMTDKNNTNFQRILNETSGAVAAYSKQLDPLIKLAEVFERFGVSGNIIEQLNLAVKQKQERDEALALATQNHNKAVFALENEIDSLKAQIKSKKLQHDLGATGLASFFNKKSQLSLEADIRNLESELAEREEQKRSADAKTITIPDDVHGDELKVSEDILQLQNLGGPEFAAKLEELRSSSELTFAQIASNFDDAMTGLNTQRVAFTTMDRGCTDTVMVLSILNVALDRAKLIVREKATSLIAPSSEPVNADEALAKLDKMERERRSEQLLAYSESLQNFSAGLAVAIAGLTESQAVIKRILQMNQQALNSANTQRITGIANTSSALTITIGSIIEVCNRGASSALSDGLAAIKDKADRGNERLTSGAAKGLEQQNRQFESLATALADIRDQTDRIKLATDAEVEKQAQLVTKINIETGKLADATTEAQRATFEARAGVKPVEVVAEEDAPEHKSFGFKRKH